MSYRSATLTRMSENKMFPRFRGNLDDEQLAFVDRVYFEAELWERFIGMMVLTMPPFLVIEQFDTMEDVKDYLGLQEELANEES